MSRIRALLVLGMGGALAAAALPPGDRGVGLPNSAGRMPIGNRHDAGDVSAPAGARVGPTAGGRLVWGVDNLDPRPFDLLMTTTTVDPLDRNCIGDVSQDGLISGVAFGPADVLYGYNQSTNQFISIDTKSGASVVIRTLSPGHTLTGMAWDRDNSKMFLCDSGGGLWTIDPVTGVLGARVPHRNPDGTAPFLGDVAAYGGQVYGLEFNHNVTRLDGAGQAWPLGPLGITVKFSQGLAFDPNDGTLYLGPVNNIPHIFGDWGTVDLETGLYTRIGALGICFSTVGPVTEYGDFDIMLETPCDPCDCNCDGQVNAFDIEPFIGIIFNNDPPCGGCTADVNGDGQRNAFDVEPFIQCLFGP